MIARNSRTLVLNASRHAQRRAYANPPNPAADAAAANANPGGRSNALVVASAVTLFLGGLGFYNYSVTGRPQNLGKAIAKSESASQTSGGLGRMDAKHELAMGGAEEESETADRRPPTRRPPQK